jgi:hypothetical protein
MHTDASDTAADTGPRRIKPHQVVIGLGVGMAVFTALRLWA